MIINRRFQTPAIKKSSFMQRIFISDAKLQTAPNVPEGTLHDRGCLPTPPIDAPHNKSDRLLTRTGGAIRKTAFTGAAFFLSWQATCILAGCMRQRRWLEAAVVAAKHLERATAARSPRLARPASIAPLAFITFLARRACYQG